MLRRTTNKAVVFANSNLRGRGLMLKSKLRKFGISISARFIILEIHTASTLAGVAARSKLTVLLILSLRQPRATVAFSSRPRYILLRTQKRKQASSRPRFSVAGALVGIPTTVTTAPVLMICLSFIVEWQTNHYDD